MSLGISVVIFIMLSLCALIINNMLTVVRVIGHLVKYQLVHNNNVFC